MRGQRPLADLGFAVPADIAKAYIPVTGGGVPPTPVAGYVNIDGKRVSFVIGVGRNRLDPIPPQLSVPQVKRRTFWYVENRGR